MLALRHVGNCLVRQIQIVSGGIALVFIAHRVTVVVVSRPRQRYGNYQQKDDGSKGYTVHTRITPIKRNHPQPSIP